MSSTVPTLKREGFAGQKLRVVPRTIIRAALGAPITSQILVTDCGYFPQAGSHGRVRPGGAGQTIVIVCSQGRGWAEIEGTRHEVFPRQALIIPRRAAHAYGAQAGDPWTIWWLHLAGEQMPQLTAACGVTVQRPVMDVPRFALSVALIGEAIDTLEHDDTPQSLLAASGAAWHLMTALAAGRPDAPRDDPVTRMKEFLSENLASQLSIAQLAERVNLSPSHLTAIFRASTGYSPMAYRTLMRMQRARMLLDTSDKPILAIAREVGYEDPAYFSRRFAELHELGPRDYRRTSKG
jgi:AraC-like DNA-binding protein